MNLMSFLYAILLLSLTCVHCIDNDEYGKLLQTVDKLQESVLHLQLKVIDLEVNGHNKTDPGNKSQKNETTTIDAITTELLAMFTELRSKAQDIPMKQDAQIALLQAKDKQLYEEMAYVAKPTHWNHCKRLFDSGYKEDGVYTILLRESGFEFVPVWCDMTNGGWLVIQKRFDGSQDFNKTFVEYSKGFGRLDGEYWLGLNNVHKLTELGKWDLRVDLESFDSEFAYAEYSEFTIGAGPDFILDYDHESYRGTAGDSLSTMHRHMSFTTKDHDSDWNYGNCANNHGGAWWFRNCADSNLNAWKYGNGGTELDTMFWEGFKNRYPLKSSTMKIRPVY